MTAVPPKGNAGDRTGHKAEVFTQEKSLIGLKKTSKFSIPPTWPVPRSSISEVFSSPVTKNLQLWQAALSLVQMSLMDLSNKQPHPY